MIFSFWLGLVKRPKAPLDVLSDGIRDSECFVFTFRLGCIYLYVIQLPFVPVVTSKQCISCLLETMSWF